MSHAATTTALKNFSFIRRDTSELHIYHRSRYVLTASYIISIRIEFVPHHTQRNQGRYRLQIKDRSRIIYLDPVLLENYSANSRSMTPVNGIDVPVLYWFIVKMTAPFCCAYHNFRLSSSS